MCSEVLACMLVGGKNYNSRDIRPHFPAQNNNKNSGWLFCLCMLEEIYISQEEYGGSKARHVVTFFSWWVTKPTDLRRSYIR